MEDHRRDREGHLTKEARVQALKKFETTRG